MARDNILTIKGARLLFKNFSGKGSKFNPEGRRNFCVYIDDPELADHMKEDGWNVRMTNPRYEDETPKPYVQVAVNFDRIPPKIHLISRRGETLIEEDEVNMLDWAEIENVDMTINPRYWEDDNGNKRIKAYLRSMYVTIFEDELDQLYSDKLNSNEEDVPF